MRPRAMAFDLAFAPAVGKHLVRVTDMQPDGHSYGSTYSIREEAVDLLPCATLLDDQPDKVLLLYDRADEPCFLDGAGSACDPSGLRYCVGDATDSPYCARHFYQNLVAGDGVTGFTLSDDCRTA